MVGNPSDCRSASISLKARREEPPKRPAWALCLTTSVGTRMVQAAISPSDEASMWAYVCLRGDVSASINDLLTPSYTRKKEAADGIDPSIAEGRPAYMLRNVPRRVCRAAIEAFCCCVVRLDCKRVLMVSRGKRETSTVRPAIAPDCIDQKLRVRNQLTIR